MAEKLQKVLKELPSAESGHAGLNEVITQNLHVTPYERTHYERTHYERTHYERTHYSTSADTLRRFPLLERRAGVVKQITGMSLSRLVKP